MGKLSVRSCSVVDLPERYTTLSNLLILRQWERANQETTAIVLDLAGRTEDGWLWLEDFAQFPYQELRLLNQLWLNHSSGRFGFSVQQRIWRKVAALEDYEAECCVGNQVEWRHADGDWLTYDEIRFDFSAPRGHLPLAFAWWVDGAGVVLGGVGKFWQAASARRFNAAQLSAIVPTATIEVASSLLQFP